MIFCPLSQSKMATASNVALQPNGNIRYQLFLILESASASLTTHSLIVAIIVPETSLQKILKIAEMNTLK